MRLIYFFLFIHLLCAPALNGQIQQDTGRAGISFAYKKIKLGKIPANQYQKIEFPFLNTGTIPFFITRVAVASSMYVPTYPKEPIAPRAKAKITIGFSGALGLHQRDIAVFTSIREEPYWITIEYEGVPTEPISKSDSLAPQLLFMHTLVDVDSISQHTIQSVSYRFVNTGKSPLIISNAQSSCGCLVASWPKEPIMPGKTGEIKVQFSPTGKLGNQYKTITVQSNGSVQTIVLHFKCIIVAENTTQK